MANTHKVNYSALAWVQGELQKAIAAAARSLQQFFDQTDHQHLSDCTEQLYQVNGTLEMLNFQGAQLLAAEMQSLTQHLHATDSPEQDDIREALFDSLLILPRYLQLLRPDFADHPICLISSINTLRQLGNKTPFIESDLFAAADNGLPPEFQSSVETSPPRLDIPDDQLAHSYQYLLLNWLREEDTGSLRKLRSITHYLRLSSSDNTVIKRWWVSEAIFEALLHRGLAADAVAKQFLGKLVQPIRKQTAQQTVPLDAVFPEALYQQALLLVARAKSHGQLVSSVKNHCGLHFFDQQQVIYGVSDTAIAQAYQALAEDLQQLQSQLQEIDGDSPDTVLLEDIAQQLLTLSDTLNMLKQPAAAQALEQQHQQLTDPTPQATPPFTELAELLLIIENQVRQHASPDNDSNVATAQSIAINECHDELRQLQESLLQIPEDAALTPDMTIQFQQGLQQLSGSMDMLTLNAAANCLQTTAEMLADTTVTSRVWSFAKILSAIELYLDTLQLTGESDQQLLDQANAALAKLTATSISTSTAISPDPLPAVDADNAISISEAVSDVAASNEAVDFAESVDAEIASVFVEEAEQLLADLARWIPAWQQQPTLTLLSDIRRHFHTLKGSGRMAGAQHVGELAWQLEALLNQKLACDNLNAQAIAEILQPAPAVLVELVNHFSHGAPDNSPAATTLISRIDALRQPTASDITETGVARYLRNQQTETETGVARYIKARIQITTDILIAPKATAQTGVSRYLQKLNALSETGVTRYLRQKIATLPADNPETSVSRYIRQQQAEQPDDAELQQIFIIEARQRIQQLQLSLNRFYAGDVIQATQPDTAHALKGCANIAGHAPLGDVATRLEQRLRSWHHHQYPLQTQDIEQLRNIVWQLSALVEKPGDTDPLDNYHQLLTDIEQLPAGEVSPDNGTVMDRDNLVSFLEATDALLDQYAAQLSLWQQDKTFTDQDALLSTLTVLAETADNAGLHPLVALYTQLKTLISHPQSQDPRLAAIVASISEALNDQLEALVQRQPLPDTAPLNSHIQTVLATLETETAQQVTAIPLAETLPLSEADDHANDLLATFIEEAAELLFSADQAIKSWRQNPTDETPALQLQRDLHTLKGGARLAAIAEMADLTHHTESLVLVVCEANHAADAAFFDLLHRCQDALSQMQEDLQSNLVLQPASGLQDSLSKYLQNSPAVVADTSAITFSESKANKPFSATLNPGEQIRVRADLLDYLSNFAGEVSISRDRITQQHHAMSQQLTEMADTVSRLHEQLRKLEIETETQILFRYEDPSPTHHADFDPLELDRFSTIQQLSRGLSESVVDLQDIGRSMDTLVRETDSILVQQSRLNSDLQQGLMHTRLLPFSHIVPRLERIVRQTNEETGKQAAIVVKGANQELDRAVLDRLIAPIEHILRNAIAHGIETPEQRRDSDKPETGQLVINVQREGTEVVMILEDDGRGLNLDKIRQKALESGIINPRNVPADDALIQLILTSGFSTADTITQLAGRGVGLDVVNNEIRALKGRLSIASQGGHGARFEIRLPLTLSVIQALLISVNQQSFAIPLASVAIGERISVAEIQQHLSSDEPQYQTDHGTYQFVALSNLLAEPLNLPENPAQSLPVLLFRSGSTRIALLVDAVHGNREIVIKSLGKQLSRINALNGATILGDGQVVLILDIPTMVSVHQRQLASHDYLPPVATAQKTTTDTPRVMVVDDSITMRKATGSLLERLGFSITTAKDGVEALAQLYEQIPEAILLDVEMPRMDGFEFAAIIRNDPQFQHIPIIMITSRTGDKHRQRAESIGIWHYLGKPYQEQELIEALQQLLENRYPSFHSQS